MDSWGEHMQDSWTWKLMELSIPEVHWATKMAEQISMRRLNSQSSYQIIQNWSIFLSLPLGKINFYEKVLTKY